MSQELSVVRILTELKEQIEHSRSQEAFHAQKEAFHREQRELHAADLQTALERFSTFEAAAAAAGELVARARQARKEKEKRAVDDSIPAGTNVLSKLVARIVLGKDLEETFGATLITQELLQRYGARLEREVDVRSVAAKLRRMARNLEIHCVREGRSFHEALYRRGAGQA